MVWAPNLWGGCELNENVAPSPFKEFAAVATKTFASPRRKVINQSHPPLLTPISSREVVAFLKFAVDLVEILSCILVT
jgi:hypothetical protein